MSCTHPVLSEAIKSRKLSVLHRYIFYLLSDGRSVNDIHLNKVGSSVITSCVSSCLFTLNTSKSNICITKFLQFSEQMTVLSDNETNFLFLGSRVGDSLLLRYNHAKVEDLHVSQEQGLALAIPCATFSILPYPFPSQITQRGTCST